MSMIRVASKTAFGVIPTFFSRLSSSSSVSGAMSERHLTKGSSIPPFTGKLRVYNMRFCPYAQRTILALNAKNVPYEIVNINLTEKPEWLTSKSPLGKVPALEIEDGVIIYESLVTCEYIDDVYKQNPLTSNNPLRKAQDKLIVENFNKTISAFYKLVINNDMSVEEQFFEGLDAFQSHLTERSTRFLHGESPGMVDYMTWPWIERLGLMPIFGGEKFNIGKEKYGTLLKYIEAMKQDAAVKSYYLETEIHNKFIYERKTGNYDFLL